jgi:hypothetical protein
MSKKIHESAEVVGKYILPAILVLLSAVLSKQLSIPILDKILIITEIVLFLIAFGLNIYQFLRLSLALNTPPLCMRESCKGLKWITLMLAWIMGVYAVLSGFWFAVDYQQSTILSLDISYTVLEILLAIFAINFAGFLQRYIQVRCNPADQNAKSPL